ncbi:hypothetical protein SAMN05444401_3551 [Clostridium amylolyticum]|uniref:Uncharacterized protein n=1 Tax=Clostridium amylolyticum TaxID=1121298 RepID=A0A1M6KZA1_9CLOT|nr:hypothetical protein [Clostridium amylolyticum]SHJ64323.1 hypothetical protein SAMN05444401_3551 [Clostridium amylolyticum]
MDEPTVTISLSEYNRLRDESDMKRLLLDKITFYENRLMDLERRMYQLEHKS